ncbi:arginine/serine-rich coiled-coil protein 2 isoform X2 [Manduca sexta]|uniref:arginine/serine-rich coiled-coil protein 2 isoform X2 n=1 Tax=Manduca sexta TaxID=7130 RepID=UPI00189075D3|nr:arginine/serine-rich coiled-coil protein 2 isoform X2 [Manduca sexta]
MDSLIAYGSDDEVDSDRYGGHQQSTVGGGGSQRRRDDDTNYDDVNMELSEDSQGAESEPELPPAEPVATSRHSSREDRRGSDDSRSRSRSDRSERDDREKRSHRRDSPPRGRSRPDRSDRPDRHERSDRHDRPDRPDRSDRSDRSDDSRRSERSERSERSRYEGGSSRRGLLGDRPEDGKVPALMDLRPFGGEPPPGFDQRKSHDARDAVSPRFTDRDRRDRERDRERHSRRSEEKRSGHRGERRSRSRSRSRGTGAAYPPPAAHNERRTSPTSGDYRPSSYKVNKKLEVMEKMGLQIKTPDGSMATAQQLRAAASEAPPSSSGLPSYYNPSAVNTNKILDQKRKLLWSNKNKSDAEEAAKWSGTRFAQDSDGKQVSKFMRLMGIKEPAAVKPENTDKNGDPIKKQEELFQAMQAQYEVARATTHTMRGVGLGFQRGQY